MSFTGTSARDSVSRRGSAQSARESSSDQRRKVSWGFSSGRRNQVPLALTSRNLGKLIEQREHWQPGLDRITSASLDSQRSDRTLRLPSNKLSDNQILRRERSRNWDADMLREKLHQQPVGRLKEKLDQTPCRPSTSLARGSLNLPSGWIEPAELPMPMPWEKQDLAGRTTRLTNRTALGALLQGVCDTARGVKSCIMDSGRGASNNSCRTDSTQTRRQHEISRVVEKTTIQDEAVQTNVASTGITARNQMSLAYLGQEWMEDPAKPSALSGAEACASSAAKPLPVCRGADRASSATRRPSVPLLPIGRGAACASSATHRPSVPLLPVGRGAACASSATRRPLVPLLPIGVGGDCGSAATGGSSTARPPAGSVRRPLLCERPPAISLQKELWTQLRARRKSAVAMQQRAPPSISKREAAQDIAQKLLERGEQRRPSNVRLAEPVCFENLL